MSDTDTNKLLLVIIAILLAPLAVFLKEGAGKELVICLLLWFLTLGIGGMIYALYIVLK